MSRHEFSLNIWLACFRIFVLRCGADHSRSCTYTAIDIEEGLCNGTKFSIKTCIFNGIESSKLEKFKENAMRISKFMKSNCPGAQPIDAACKSYFPDARVLHTFCALNIIDHSAFQIL